MDSVDGQLARLRRAGSVRGEWLDHTVDCFKTSSLHLAVAISWYRFPPTDERAALLIPLGFSVVQSVTFFGLILLPALRKQAGARPASADATSEHPLRKWLILPTDYGFLCWVFVLLAWPTVFFGVYAALFVLSAAMLAVALRKWWRELGALDGQRA
jgi:phosphatidylglycerophosphate synthase